MVAKRKMRFAKLPLIYCVESSYVLRFDAVANIRSTTSASQPSPFNILIFHFWFTLLPINWSRMNCFRTKSSFVASPAEKSTGAAMNENLTLTSIHINTT